jgi:hypothetical protein
VVALCSTKSADEVVNNSNQLVSIHAQSVAQLMKQEFIGYNFR